MQSSWTLQPSAFPGGFQQNQRVLRSPWMLLGSWSYWKRTTWGFESPRTACKFMSMKAWAKILRAKECTALISENFFIFYLSISIYLSIYLSIYIYTIQIYTVHQFPPQVLIWIAHFTAFPIFSMLSLQVPPALTPRATNAPPLTAELGTT